MKVNVNKMVRITLTKCGAEWLNHFNQKYVDDYMEVISRLSTTADDIKRAFPTNYQEGMEIECPIWELMRYFGGYFLLRTEAPFTSNEFDIIGE